MSRGRPFERGNKFGRGRPKGSRNKKKPIEGQQLFEQHSAAIMALAINSSREDPQMLRMLASRIAPRQRESPVRIGRLPIGTLADLDRASGLVLQNACSGKIQLSDAREIFHMIELRRRVLVAQELEQRLNLLENGGGAHTANASGAPKKFDGTLEELLALYRQLTVQAEEPGDQADQVAA